MKVADAELERAVCKVARERFGLSLEDAYDLGVRSALS